MVEIGLRKSRSNGATLSSLPRSLMVLEEVGQATKFHASCTAAIIAALAGVFTLMEAMTRRWRR